MVPTEHLFATAEAEGIAIEICSMPPPLLGFYLAENNHLPVIALSSKIERNERLFRCVLAEELGHHFTCVGDYAVRPYRTYDGRIWLAKAEKRALKWAATALMPSDALFAARWETIYDISEAFYVTPAFVRAALSLPPYSERLARVFTMAITARVA